MNLRIFGPSYAVAALALLAAFAYDGVEGLFVCAILGVLEVSLSFDNAVVNATILERMAPVWQRIFLTVGVLIAVVGMRLLFPLVVVSVTAGLDPVDAVELALAQLPASDPNSYAATLNSVYPQIAAFGGTFLLMLFLDWLFTEREITWLSWVERPLARIGRVQRFSIVIALATLVALAETLAEDPSAVLVAGTLGLVVYLLVHGLGEHFARSGGLGRGGVALATGRAAFFLFLYLELIDAAFSFDGVIGAFAITTDPIVIALGLGFIGAMFVRSLTVFLVRKGTLDQLVYLDHGAHWAIGALSVVLLIGIGHHVNEVVTGLVGVAFIGTAFLSSIWRNRKRARRDRPGPRRPGPRRGAGPRGGQRLMDPQKAALHDALQAAREALLGKLDGVDEYAVRRPLTGKGTNLLGLVKHVAGVTMTYFGETFDRPVPDPPLWLTGDSMAADPLIDLFAAADESRAEIVALYGRAWAHADATIAALPLDATGTVAHWPPERATVTLHRILVHVLAEVARHAGHADVLREGLDGSVGLRRPGDNVPDADAAAWAAHRDRVDAAARAASGVAAADRPAAGGAAGDRAGHRTGRAGADADRGSGTGSPDADDVRIGPLAVADAGEVLTVQRAAYVTEAQRYRAPDIPPLREGLDALRADLARADGAVLVALGAWLGPRLVGSVRGRVDGEAMEVARLTVAPDVQGRGVGRALLAAVHAAAPAAVRSTWLVTGAASDDNRRLYAAAGYAPVDTVRDAAGVELVRMRRVTA